MPSPWNPIIFRELHAAKLLGLTWKWMGWTKRDDPASILQMILNGKYWPFTFARSSSCSMGRSYCSPSLVYDLFNETQELNMERTLLRKFILGHWYDQTNTSQLKTPSHCQNCWYRVGGTTDFVYNGLLLWIIGQWGRWRPAHIHTATNVS